MEAPIGVIGILIIAIEAPVGDFEKLILLSSYFIFLFCFQFYFNIEIIKNQYSLIINV